MSGGIISLSILISGSFCVICGVMWLISSHVVANTAAIR